MKYAVTTALAVVVTLSAAGVAQAAPGAEPARAGRAPAGQVHIIQAVPDDTVRVAVDGRTVRDKAGVGAVLGPLSLAAGDHTVTFTSTGGMSLTSDLVVQAGSASDIVLHRPAAVGGDPTISSYATPETPIGPGRARVLIAHTATVAPADVRLDGKVVSRNIANGEFDVANVASGKHVVALLPTGLSRNPILGPIEVDLAPQTVTMVYAVGNPDDASMEVIAHVVPLRADGSVAPDRIDTGSAGLAADVAVRPFGETTTGGAPGAGLPAASLAALALLLAALTGLTGLLLRRTRTRATT